MQKGGRKTFNKSKSHPDSPETLQNGLIGTNCWMKRFQIEPTDSSWYGSMFFLTYNGDGAQHYSWLVIKKHRMRFCVEYRALNAPACFG